MSDLKFTNSIKSKDIVSHADIYDKAAEMFEFNFDVMGGDRRRDFSLILKAGLWNKLITADVTMDARTDTSIPEDTVRTDIISSVTFKTNVWFWLMGVLGVVFPPLWFAMVFMWGTQKKIVTKLIADTLRVFTVHLSGR